MVQITFTPSPEAADPTDATGVTEETFNAILAFISPLSEDDIQIERTNRDDHDS